MPKYEIPVQPGVRDPAPTAEAMADYMGPLPADAPVIEMPEHIRGYIPKGQEAILVEEERLAEEMVADWHTQQGAHDLDRELEYGRHAETPSFKAKLVGRLALVREAAERRFVGGLEYHHAGQDDFSRAAHALREAGALENERDKQLDQVRAHLDEFEVMQRDETIHGEVVPNELRHALDAYLKNELPVFFQNDYSVWVKRLNGHGKGAGDRVEWLAKSSDDMLLNFLQWHNDRVDRMNADPAFHEKIRDMKQQVKNRIKADVMDSNNGLPREALLSFKRIDDVRVISGDIFDTAMEYRLGYFIHNPGHIVVGEDFDQDTFQHEIYHAALGHLDNRIMNESMTEHLTLAAMNGGYKQLNPARRSDMGAYYKFRQTNDRILTSGIHEVPIESQIGAYIEGDGDGPKARKFRQELNGAYGNIVDVMEFIEAQTRAGYYEARHRNPDMPYHELMDHAAADVSRSMVLLGNLAKGSSYDQIREGIIKNPNRSTSAWLTQLDQVQKYIEHRQGTTVGSNRDRHPVSA